MVMGRTARALTRTHRDFPHHRHHRQMSVVSTYWACPKLAYIYLVPGVRFPPAGNPPPGYITHTNVNRALTVP